MTTTTAISLPGTDPIEPASAGTEFLRAALAGTPGHELPELTVALAGLAPLPATLQEPLTVGQAAELLTLSPHTLRYYERIGLVAVPRDPGGNRAYDLPSLTRLVFISRLRLTGMPVRTISTYFDLVRDGEGTRPQRLSLLSEHREALRRHLHELQFALAVIDYKIAGYSG